MASPGEEEQCVIGKETRLQMIEAEGRLPDSLVACIGDGSNAIGLFHPFLDEPTVEMYGVEAAGRGLKSGMHAASIVRGRPPAFFMEIGPIC
ncbi:tryptophan synthase beta chain [Afipia broomeae ATCC 49717]|uniref:Tryptophan synthase beta chain n=1 Tax=Afipia broomeae ATCC 49717 TaxID=883078 RepID=K8PI23_9BRAD|nr:tryptophan synthase beta chain [Afipia broomeae ATCC 49717]